MKKWTALLLGMLLICVCACAPAAEGDPLLSVDDLLALEDSFSAFLSELEALAVERGLLSEEERGIWRDAQMGDFFQNGGYGSVLINYMPGVLGYLRDEDTLMQLSVQLESGMTHHVDTRRRYTPGDSSLSGLMLTLNMTDASGAPVNAQFSLSGTSGVFLKWDVLTGAYISVGAAAQSDGDTVVWSGQAPIEGAKNPEIIIAATDAQTQQPLPGAKLTLVVDGDGYLIGSDALSAQPAQ